MTSNMNPSRGGRRFRLRWLAAAAITLSGAALSVTSRPAAADIQPSATGVIVTLAPGATIAEVNARHTSVTLGSIDSIQVYLVGATDGRTTDQLLVELASDPGVLVAEVNKTARTPEVSFSGRIYKWTSAPPSAAGTQWAWTALSLPAAQTLSSGSGVTVAVIDSGISSSHPLFANAPIAAGYDFIDNDPDPADVGNGIDENRNGVVDEGVGHGTHVAGIVRQVAPSATILPIRALDSDGNSDTFTIAEAMTFARDRGAQVLSMSLGSEGSSGLIRNLAEQLWAGGVMVIGAAGNEGRERTSFPAAAKCALGVTSVGRTNAISAFSTTGKAIDTAAPGEDIVSAFPDGGYVSWSGTSMATPIVAAEAAMLRARRPDLAPGAIARLIVGNTVPIVGPTGRIGSGRVDLVAALKAAPAATNSTACLR